MHRRLVLALLAAIIAGSTLRADPVYDEAGVALGGMDPVAYHTQGAARPGDPDQALMWRGSEWRFADAANRRLFEGDPKRYMPAFGGYSAVAVAEGRLLPGDPHIWVIRRGRLFLHDGPDARDRFSEAPDTTIERAAARWPDLED